MCESESKSESNLDGDSESERETETDKEPETENWTEDTDKHICLIFVYKVIYRAEYVR